MPRPLKRLGYGLIKAGRVDAGVAELSDVAAWFNNPRLSDLHLFATLWLVEGLLAIGDRSTARVLVVSRRRSGAVAHNGARPMRRLLQETLEDAIAAGLLEENYHKGDVVSVNVKKSSEPAEAEPGKKRE